MKTRRTPHSHTAGAGIRKTRRTAAREPGRRNPISLVVRILATVARRISLHDCGPEARNPLFCRNHACRIAFCTLQFVRVAGTPSFWAVGAATENGYAAIGVRGDPVASGGGQC